MSSCLPMDVLGVTKSILSGDDSYSWIQSILMSENEKKKLLHDIDKLAQILLNDQEKIRLRKLIHLQAKSLVPFFEVNNTLARNSLQTSSKKLVESYVFNGELNFDSLEYMSGKMILNYEFDRVISSLKAGREWPKNHFHIEDYPISYLNTFIKCIRSMLTEKLIYLYTASTKTEDNYIIWKVENKSCKPVKI
ncbi:MAG: hypothetical protein VXX39_01120 [Candidatus Thermoplasmatota archaeon]|nr:hypothetical protein [Candidatus Thermoplasmatota archaeon]